MPSGGYISLLGLKLSNSLLKSAFNFAFVVASTEVFHILLLKSILNIFRIEFTPTSSSQPINTFTSEEVLKALVQNKNIKFYINLGGWKTRANIISWSNSTGKPSTETTTTFWVSGNNTSQKVDFYLWCSPGSKPTIRTN